MYLCIPAEPQGMSSFVPCPSEPATLPFMPGVPRTGFQISLPDLALPSRD